MSTYPFNITFELKDHIDAMLLGMAMGWLEVEKPNDPRVKELANKIKDAIFKEDYEHRTH